MAAEDEFDVAWQRLEESMKSLLAALEREIVDPRGDPHSRYVIEMRLEMIRAAQVVCRLSQHVSSSRGPRLRQELDRVKHELGLDLDQYHSAVAFPRRFGFLRIMDELRRAEQEAEAELRGEPSRTWRNHVPAAIRVCGATLVGALIGAPIGALAIQEAVGPKITESLIVGSASAIAAEILGPLSERLGRPRAEWTEPDASANLTPFDLVIGAVDRTVGALPDTTS